MGLFDSEESFKKGYKKAGVKTLRSFISEVGLVDEDDDLKSMTKPEVVEIINNYMGYDKKSKGGLADTKKKYVNKVKIINNLKKKKK